MNISGLLELFDGIPPFEELIARLENSQSSSDPLLPLDLSGGLRPPTVAQLYRRVAQPAQAPILLVTARVETTSHWQQALESWLPESNNLLRLPEPTPLPYDRAPWSDRTRQARIRVLAEITGGHHPSVHEQASPPLIITSARAFLQKTIPRQRFAAGTRILRVGQMLDLEKSFVAWKGLGYEFVSVVELPGQYSRRGGIVDIFPPAAELPVRIELFGDQIDTMRFFDPTTQRSLTGDDQSKIVQQVTITPAREALPAAAAALADIWQDNPATTGNDLPSWRDDLAGLQSGQAFSNLEFYLPMVYPRPANLLDYLPKNGLVIVDDWDELARTAAELHDHGQQVASEQLSLPPGYPNPVYTWEEISSELAWWQPLVLGKGSSVVSKGTTEPIFIDLAENFDPVPRYGGQVRPFLNHLKRAQNEGERVVVFSRQASRLAELWREEGGTHSQPVSSAVDLSDGKPPLNRPAATADTVAMALTSLPVLPPEGTLSFVQGGLMEGLTLVRQEDRHALLYLLTDAEVFGWSRPAPRRLRQSRPTAPETYFADIKKGDYVVHLDYGIGLFEGLVVRMLADMEREYLLVQYANGDTLYVPVHHADRIGKWIGPDDASPKLNRLGEKSWGQSRASAQRAADELAGELLNLYAERETVSGHAFAADTDWQAEMEASFPYPETEDQLRVIAEVKEDMERPQPMDRLICGDVGYGKTEVALRAAFKAVMDGRQVAILVPTTILAQQHYSTFRQRLAAFPVEVEMLSRFRTPAQQRAITQKLRQGQIDIVIGTHRLLSDDVSFKDLGLVVVDEEQRFGVAHKEKLKQWRTEVDVLTLTATPIPRTLHMALTGVRDISVIDTAPADRLPVQTYVGEADEAHLRTAILRELDRGGQIFFVHNRVQSIHIIRRRLEELVPHARIAVGHGQMGERQLEKIMLEFEAGKIDILLSTTIIESGLDFPNANTLIIDRAEQFGLSQLYQLRGRVGRGTRRAYAYLFHAPWRSLTPDAQARLETIAEATQLGAGYFIAMRDMEIRGAGDFLGGQQSGHVAAVGFDMYTRLLTRAVKRRKAELRGETTTHELPENVLIDLPLATYIPTDYVPEARLRLRLYRRMATMDTLAEIDEMAAELADRFGPIPDPLHNLLYQLRIKALAQMASVTGVVTEAGQIRIRLTELTGMDRFHLQRFLGDSLRVSKSAIWLRPDMGTHDWQVLLVQTLERLRSFDRQGPDSSAESGHITSTGKAITESVSK